MCFVICTKLNRDEFQKLKEVCTKKGYTHYNFAKMAIVEKLQLQNFDDREPSTSKALETEEKRFMQELHAIKSTLLSYVKNKVGDMLCPNCGKPWVEHDLETIIAFVKNIAGDRQCKNCRKPLVEHDFDTILWALHTFK